MISVKQAIPFVFCIFIPILTILRLLFISRNRANAVEGTSHPTEPSTLQPNPE
ncbi:hypothetical protein [Baia soyae]|uniref:Uncharacterized protein n=1 Tax=Baia soyae TaxID=1544746 RepID=A0A4R2RPH6_9BACL|nr:hypothetical protein [Baia soyae]TCP64619.1 hypothetical protein EDD57_1382 [Baia soyae]